MHPSNASKSRSSDLAIICVSSGMTGLESFDGMHPNKSKITPQTVWLGYDDPKLHPSDTAAQEVKAAESFHSTA